MSCFCGCVVSLLIAREIFQPTIPVSFFRYYCVINLLGINKRKKEGNFTNGIFPYTVKICRHSFQLNCARIFHILDTSKVGEVLVV